MPTRAQRGRELDQKRKLKNNTNKPNVLSITASGTGSSPHTIPATPLVEQDTAKKILSCMMHAHLMNSVEPGTYNDELNRALKLNNLPLIILPSNSPSKKIPNLNDNQHDPQGHQTTKAQQPTPNNTSMPHQNTIVQME